MNTIRTLAALVGLASLATSQVNKSNLTGIVRDASGAPVAEAKITLTNTETGTSRAEVSDDSGFYRFTLLDRGIYRLTAERPSFKRFQRDGVELQTGETTTVDVTLTLGEVAESV